MRIQGIPGDLIGIVEISLSLSLSYLSLSLTFLSLLSYPNIFFILAHKKTPGSLSPGVCAAAAVFIDL